MRHPALLGLSEQLAAAMFEDRPSNAPLSVAQVREAITYLKGIKAILDAALPDRLFVVLQESIGQDHHGDLLRHSDEGLSILSLNIGKLLEAFGHQLPGEDTT